MLIDKNYLMELNITSRKHFKNLIKCNIIFTDVNNRIITIGGTGTTVVSGGNMKISGNILADQDETKMIFTDVANNDMIVGASGDGSIIMRNTLQVNEHITTDSKEHKEIFVDIEFDNSVLLLSIYNKTINKIDNSKNHISNFSVKEQENWIYDF